MGDSKRAWDDGDNDFSNAATTRYEETHQSRTMQQSASTPVLPGYAAAAYATPKKFFAKATGTPDLHDYRVHFYLDHDGHHVNVSPWHDIPLKAPSGAYHFVCEIPKWSRKKFEISTKEGANPILQDKDKKTGNLRSYVWGDMAFNYGAFPQTWEDIPKWSRKKFEISTKEGANPILQDKDKKTGNLRSYVWGDMAFNYGAFPQTWEDPDEISPHTNHAGDDDPLDVIELSGRAFDTGAIVEVKVLGVIAMIDSGETDWKVIAIHTKDPLAKLLNDVEDVHKHCHGAIPAIVEWLRLYKTHKGVINKFAFNGECKNRAFAEEIIHECHQFWKRRPDVKSRPSLRDRASRRSGRSGRNLPTNESSVEELAA